MTPASAEGAALLLRGLDAIAAKFPGIGGAPPIGGPDGPLDSLPTIGADLSFVTAFFSFLPASMSPSRPALTHG